MRAFFFVTSGVFGVELESALDGVPEIPARPCLDLRSHTHPAGQSVEHALCGLVST